MMQISGRTLSVVLLAACAGLNSYAVTAQQVIPREQLKVVYVDSQETVSRHGLAQSAIDGNPRTIWHTQWYSSDPKPPHEIQIDLSKIKTVSAMRYLPRQDGYSYGSIADYVIQVSQDRRAWIEVARGRFDRTRTEKRVPFKALNARYLKLVALSEVNGGPWASAAEFLVEEVISRLSPTSTTAPPATSPSNPPAAEAKNDAVDWASRIANASGTVRFVSTAEQFNTAAAISRPGDVVVVKNGTYAGWKLSIRSRGTAEQPIIYTAQTPGGVTFTGSQQNALVVYGEHNIVGGFRFSNCGGYFVRFIGAKYNRFTDSSFTRCSGNAPADRILEVYGGSNDNRFDHLIFDDNRSIGFGILLPRAGVDSFAPSLRNRVDHNTFKNVSRRADGGMSPPLQIGQWLGEDKGIWPDSSTLVEHNEFRNINGQAVNSKSNGEIYRNNRFYQVAWEALSLRGGDNKVVEGNYFENVKIPIQAYGRNHRIINNVMIKPEIGVLLPKWGNYQISAGGKISTSPASGNMLVAHNTITDCRYSAVELGRTWGYVRPGWVVATGMPVGNKIVNNVFACGSGTLFHHIDSRSTEVRNNLFYATGGAKAGFIGYQAIEAAPSLDASYAPRAGSVLIDAGLRSLGISDDAAGNSRQWGMAPDIGAYEYRP